MASASKKWATLTIKVSPELLSKVTEFAEDSGQITSAAVRLLIGMGLETKYNQATLLALIDNAEAKALSRLDELVNSAMAEIKTRFLEDR